MCCSLTPVQQVEPFHHLLLLCLWSGKHVVCKMCVNVIHGGLYSVCLCVWMCFIPQEIQPKNNDNINLKSDSFHVMRVFDAFRQLSLLFNFSSENVILVKFKWLKAQSF